MVEFSCQALAYITGAPMKEIRKLNWKEASDQFMAALQADPWLLVLDGLERVLVAYHRPEAAAMNDAAVDEAGDEMADRDPRAAIRREDDDLLRLLTKAGPSRILISSRLTPHILVNKADKYIPGVSWIELGGLTPEDAAVMLIADSIETRDRPAMQQWLQDTCGGHPLMVGALAGVVADHPPAPGDFDEWVKDPKGGAAVDFASLDLVQRRSHIVSAALE